MYAKVLILTNEYSYMRTMVHLSNTFEDSKYHHSYIHSSLLLFLVFIVLTSTASAITVSTNTRYSDDSEVYCHTSGYCHLDKYITVTQSYTGSWRIYFEYSCWNGGGDCPDGGVAYGQLYKNGVSYGSLQSNHYTPFTSIVQAFYDISITSGDVIQVDVYGASGLGSALRNFRIQFDGNGTNPNYNNTNTIIVSSGTNYSIPITSTNISSVYVTTWFNNSLWDFWNPLYTQVRMTDPNGFKSNIGTNTIWGQTSYQQNIPFSMNGLPASYGTYTFELTQYSILCLCYTSYASVSVLYAPPVTAPDTISLSVVNNNLSISWFTNNATYGNLSGITYTTTYDTFYPNPSTGNALCSGSTNSSLDCVYPKTWTGLVDITKYAKSLYWFNGQQVLIHAYTKSNGVVIASDSHIYQYIAAPETPTPTPTPTPIPTVTGTPYPTSTGTPTPTCGSFVCGYIFDPYGIGLLASITINNQTNYTTSAGWYSVPMAVSGTYNYSISSIGYPVMNGTIYFNVGQRIDWHFTLNTPTPTGTPTSSPTPTPTATPAPTPTPSNGNTTGNFSGNNATNNASGWSTTINNISGYIIGISSGIGNLTNTTNNLSGQLNSVNQTKSRTILLPAFTYALPVIPLDIKLLFLYIIILVGVLLLLDR